MKKYCRYLLIPFFALSLALAGCSGDDGAMGPPGPPGTDGTDGAPGAPGEPGEGLSLSMEDAHAFTQLNFAEVTDVRVENGTISLDFTVDGLADPGRVGVEFTIAKYVNDDIGWISMLQRNRIYTPGATEVIRASNLRQEGNNAIQANEDGSFTYTFFHGGNNIDFTQGAYWTHNKPSGEGTYGQFIDAILADIETFGAWDANATYRIGVTSRQGERFTAVAYVDGTGTPVVSPDQDNSLISCIGCHGDRGNDQTAFNAHSNRRHDPQLCTSCHNSFTFDSQNSESVVDGWVSADLMVITHSIHAGIEGYHIAESDYSVIRFPDWAFGRGNGPQNCTACHLGLVPAAGESWNKSDRSVATACATCHAQGGFPVRESHTTNNWFDCASCHGEGGFINGFSLTPDAYHGISAKLSEFAASDDYRIEIVRVEDAVEGENPIVSWQVRNVQGNLRTLDIADFSDQLRVGIGWGDGDDWINDGVGPRANGAAGDPLFVVVDGINTVVDGTQATTSFPVLPINAEAGRNAYVTIMAADAGGSGFDQGEGLPRAKPNTVIGTFILGEDIDNPINERREIVSAAKCNDCHTNMERHNTWANDDIMGCVACHNAGSLSRDASVVQGTVDLMYIVHAIHGLGEKRDSFERRYLAEEGFMYRGYPVTYPNTVLDCNACHVNDSHKLPVDPVKRLGVIGNEMQDDFLDFGLGVNAPTASVCYSCHEATGDSLADRVLRGHMTAEGGDMFGEFSHFDYVDGFPAESCTTCHKP